MTLEALTTRYLARGGPAPPDGTPPAGWLARMLAEARAAWPDLAVSDEAFVDHLAGLIRGDGPVVADLRAEDLMLACACRLGDTSAIATFIARHGDMLRTVFH